MKKRAKFPSKSKGLPRAAGKNEEEDLIFVEEIVDFNLRIAASTENIDPCHLPRHPRMCSTIVLCMFASDVWILEVEQKLQS